MYNLVWKEQSSKRWIITTAETYSDIFQGYGDNRAEWFSSRRDALNFLKDNFKEKYFIGGKYYVRPPKTYVYRRANHSYGQRTLHRFDWFNNYTYLDKQPS